MIKKVACYLSVIVSPQTVIQFRGGFWLVLTLTPTSHTSPLHDATLKAFSYCRIEGRVEYLYLVLQTLHVADRRRDD